MYFAGPQRPVNAYYPRPVSPVMSISPVYSPVSYSGSYYDHCASASLRFPSVFPRLTSPARPPRDQPQRCAWCPCTPSTRSRCPSPR